MLSISLPWRIYRGVLCLLFVGGAIFIAACSGDKSSPAVAIKSKEEAANPQPKGPPLFQDLTKESGIDFTYRNGEDDEVLAIIESLGGGVGMIDYDGDGLIDLFFPGGGYYEGKKVMGNPCKLYRNLGNFKFQDVTKEVGLEDVNWCYSHGVSVADYDCDGFPDLLVSGYSRLILLHNEAGKDGKRRFVDVTEKANLKDNLWSSSTGFGDLDGDGFPEIYVCHYGDWGFETNHPQDCYYHDAKKRDVCQPRRFKPLPHSLYKNNGNGTFTDISSELKPKELGHGLGVLFLDVNGDGRSDIYVCNDTDDNYLYMNRGAKGEIKLEEVGFLAGVARDDRGNKNGSMGVDGSSYDRTGKPSIIVTNYENELPALYSNRCKDQQISFTFGTNTSGLGILGGNFVSWGTSFFDIENRSWEDLMIVNGHAIRYPLAKFGRLQKSVLMKNVGGKFTLNTSEGGSYFQDMHNARGIAVGDLNNDGKLDVVISRLNAPVVVLKNVSENGHHWAGLELSGKKNRNLAGTKVTLTANGETQYRFVKGGGSFASANDTRLHFGLGEAKKVDSMKIEWTNGKSQTITDLPLDRYSQVKEE